MATPPTDSFTPGSLAARLPRTLMESPLATNTRLIARRRRIRQRSHPHGLRLLAALGTLVIHLVFLLIFVLGPAYEPSVGIPSKQDFLQVRLIEKPEPPPPSVRGTPPKIRGPRHRGRARPAAVVQKQQRAPLRPMLARAVPPKVSATRPVPGKTPVPRAPKDARRTPPKTVTPQPAPNPASLAMPQPTLSLPVASIKTPQPPAFQPVEVRPPQAEGNQPMPPPPSLALKMTMKMTAEPAVPKITVSTPAINVVTPPTSLPTLKTPAVAAQPAAPPAIVTAVKLTPVPSPSAIERPSNAMDIAAPSMDSPAESPNLPLVKSVASPVPAIAPAPATPVPTPEQLALPQVAITLTPKLSARVPSMPSPAPPDLSTLTEATAAAAPSITFSPPVIDVPTAIPAESAAADTVTDVSTAANAISTGRDDAVPGTASSVAPSPRAADVPSSSTLPLVTQGDGTAVGKTGMASGRQTGSAQETHNGLVGDYIQVKPHGDTDVMSHRRPGIEYKPTRFEQDWAPANEDAVTGALRRAVEKTSLKHTFHLPRGIRIECAVRPLVLAPMALLGCHNPDPPAKPLAQKIYDRLNLPPAKPLVKPVTAATVPAPVTPTKLDHSAECATARITGGPMPPGCANDAPANPVSRPASSSSSWVPASDQFHQREAITVRGAYRNMGSDGGSGPFHE